MCCQPLQNYFIFSLRYSLCYHSIFSFYFWWYFSIKYISLTAWSVFTGENGYMSLPPRFLICSPSYPVDTCPSYNCSHKPCLSELTFHQGVYTLLVVWSQKEDLRKGHMSFNLTDKMNHSISFGRRVRGGRGREEYPMFQYLLQNWSSCSISQCKNSEMKRK